MSTGEHLIAHLEDQRVLPVLRTSTARDAVDTALAMGEAGCRAVELTMSVPDVTDAVRELAAHDLVVGVGTIRSPREVSQVVDAGAQFVVSYHNPAGFVSEAIAAGVPAVPGVQTPTEAQRAVDDGATVLKLFPAWATRPRVIGDLAPLLPDIRYLVTGGLDDADIRAWLAAGALAVGLGRRLGSMAEDGPDHVHAATAAALAVAREARS